MYCKHCGKEMPDEAILCTSCGRLTDEGAKNAAINQPKSTTNRTSEFPNTELMPTNAIPYGNNKNSKAWILSMVSIVFSMCILMFASLSSCGLYYTGTVLEADYTGNHNHVFLVGVTTWALVCAWIAYIPAVTLAGLGFSMARKESKDLSKSKISLLASLIAVVSGLCVLLMTGFYGALMQ